MFSKRTVFIVGAGASAEYGLPLGIDLTQQIVQVLDNVVKFHNNSSYSREIVFAFQGILGGFPPDFMNKIYQFQKGVLHASSVDRFLNVHHDDHIMVEIGKYSIASAIIKAELDSTLNLGDSNSLHWARIRQKAPVDWLGQLFGNMQEDVSRHDIEEIFSNVSFICFNYDRCIEHYMFQAVKEFAALNDDAAASDLNHLKIYHPYGRIGKLHWDLASKDGPVGFGDTKSLPQFAASSARQLRTFTEERGDLPSISSIRNLLSEAEQIVFTGFSFLDQNMELLTNGTPYMAREIFATVYNESEQNIKIIYELINKLQRGRSGVATNLGSINIIRDKKAGEFIHDYGRMLRRS